MDFIIELIFEVIVDGCIEAGGNKKISRWIRYPLIAFVCLFFGAIITLIFVIAFSLIKENLPGAVAMGLLGLFLLVGTILKFRKIYFTKCSREEMGTADDLNL